MFFFNLVRHAGSYIEIDTYIAVLYFPRLLAEKATKCSNGDKAGTQIWTFSLLVQFPSFLSEQWRRITLNAFNQEEKKEKVQNFMIWWDYSCGKIYFVAIIA